MADVGEEQDMLQDRLGAFALGHQVMKAAGVAAVAAAFRAMLFRGDDSLEPFPHLPLGLAARHVGRQYRRRDQVQKVRTSPQNFRAQVGKLLDEDLGAHAARLPFLAGTVVEHLDQNVSFLFQLDVRDAQVLHVVDEGRKYRGEADPGLDDVAAVRRSGGGGVVDQVRRSQYDVTRVSPVMVTVPLAVQSGNSTDEAVQLSVQQVEVVRQGNEGSVEVLQEELVHVGDEVRVGQVGTPGHFGPRVFPARRAVMRGRINAFGIGVGVDRVDVGAGQRQGRFLNVSQ
mmetsp:Transcript_36833/g.68224  ORF Transcript_36833/g.68224 Transcript_36833/m.68224 type:complete len:285 (+) Transcript_36833:701-1555(+)